ncbi:Hydantoin racemase [Hartmannibacter diazotrophicus]|uniref:Hydantoin racemase n=1 Tax=Hartmannibacter diazotrophicus TaxID=1482074 RepID=A0A2C9D3Y4_9HYPH|nr:aspartate/glutamate racemase family protein [Hartmannibacter diazotrophicus]SON55037.1 Hydantoin racemase [Hartmannibacter diazotrophicus]
MTRLLLLNPNTSVDVTERMLAVARKAAAPDTEIIPFTVAKGVPYIATRAEAVIGGAMVLEALAELSGTFDAAIIAAFGDPGLGGARELMDVPVVGLAEAGMLTACMLGHRFSIVSFATALGPWYRECVAAHGLLDRLASIRLLDGSFRSIGSVPEEKADLLVDLACKAVEEDGADVIVLAGAPLAGLAGTVKTRIPVPVIEGTAAAVRQAELLVGLGAGKARAGSYRRPAPKPSTGLPPALSQLLAGGDVATV